MDDLLSRLGIDRENGPQNRESWLRLLQLMEEQRALQEPQDTQEIRRLAEVPRAILDFVIVTDLEGRITFANPAALKRFGYTGKSLNGQLLWVLFSPENPRVLAAEIYQQTFSGSGFRGEVIAMTQLGEKFPASLSASLIRDHGRATGMVSTLSDITSTKRVEAELKGAKDEAERANRFKSEFLANMSHEIRTPMNAVIGMTGLLLDSELTDEQRDFVETIRTSGDALLSIINDILDFSKMESGKLDLEDQPFELRQMVEESMDLIAPRAAEKNLNLVYEIDAGVPYAVNGDVTRVRQILVNYLGNAVKFTARGEIEVYVSARRIPPQSFEIHVSVRDTGIGIPEPRRDRLFRPFSQVDASMTRQFGGTGLGLAICKHLAEMMKGRVWAESETGKGSTFHFTILAEAASISAPKETSLSNTSLPGSRLLVVDDFASNRRVLGNICKGWGLLVKSTGSPLEALAWVRDGEIFDFAIVGQETAQMEGAGLARELKERSRRELPVLALTNLRGTSSANPASPFTGHISKPVKPTLLLNALIKISDDSLVRVGRRPLEAPINREMAKQHPLRILIAEDNVVNQKVAVQMLSRLGYRADVAANGHEVLEALRRLPYDVVFLDVQMPGMDGIEAARHVREEWGRTRGPRLIAMTANAMKGDREACLAAGMDDYISKPVQIEVLEKALKGSRQRDGDVTQHRQFSTGSAIDMSMLASIRQIQSDGEPDLLTELITLFFEDTPRRLLELENAASTGDLESVRKAAHTIKGSASSLGAKRLSALCSWLETATTLENVRETLPRLRREFDRVRVLLERERIDDQISPLS